MRVKAVLTLICLNALAGICQVVYTPYDSGAKLNWYEAKSFCEARGLVLPVLDNLVVSLIISKYPHLSQEPFWGAGRCSWKNTSGYELNFTTSRYLMNKGSYFSDLTLECYGFPDSAPRAKPCTITTNYYMAYFLPACFPVSACPTESFDYGGVCVDTPSTLGSFYKNDICHYQSRSSVDILERINKGLHLPLLSGQNATKYWISLGTYSCTNEEYPSSCDFSENGDCISLFYDVPSKQYIMNATDCGKLLAKYIMCYSETTTTVKLMSPPPTPMRQSEQILSSAATSATPIKTQTALPLTAESGSEPANTIRPTSTRSAIMNGSLQMNTSLSLHPQTTLQSSSTQNEDSVIPLAIAATSLGLLALVVTIVIVMVLHVRSSIKLIGSRLDQMSTSMQYSNLTLHKPEEPYHLYHELSPA